MRRGLLLALGVSLIVALAVGIALAVKGGGEARHVAATTRPSASEAWEKVLDAGRREAQSVNSQHWPFAAVVRAPHGMPYKLRSEAQELLGNPARLGLLFDAARYATAPDGAGIWVVSGRDVLCMFRAVNIAVACDTTAHAYRRGLLLEVYKRDKAHNRRPTSFTLLGIAPNGVRSVPVQVDGKRRAIAVVRNTFSAESRTPIKIALPSS